MVPNQELMDEIARLRATFQGADENKMEALAGMIEQAAYERLYLKRLNKQALLSGLVKMHPENAMLQKSLPVSGEIAKHSAALTNILDKLCKHLAAEQEEEEDELDEFN